MLLWVGCVAGALDEGEYRTKLASAGFEQIEIEPTRIYEIDEAKRKLVPRKSESSRKRISFEEFREFVMKRATRRTSCRASDHHWSFRPSTASENCMLTP